jgi:hypothetical protein
MKLKQRRWTFLVVGVWVLALGLTMVMEPAPAEAVYQELGWMVYTPNHPAGCAPLPYDCYVVWIWPDS